MKKICFVTGSRAEYGIMRRLLSYLQDDPEMELDSCSDSHASRRKIWDDGQRHRSGQA